MDANLKKSESISELTKALIQFHSKVSKIKKGSENPFFKSKYASLPEILDVIENPLNECDLVLMQFPSNCSGLTTVLSHSSGEYIMCEYNMNPQKEDPQGRGSAITYQRRYAIGSILNLNIDDDDDGNAASGLNNKKSENQPIKPWLNPGTETWNQAIISCTAGSDMKDGSHKVFTIQDIEKKYQLSKANREKLLDEVAQYEFK